MFALMWYIIDQDLQILEINVECAQVTFVAQNGRFIYACKKIETVFLHFINKI